MAEHGVAVKDDLKYQYGQRRRPEEIDNPELDDHGEDDFHRVKTDAGGEIEIQVAVMDHVEPPQRGHEMKYDVLKVDEKIEDDNTGEDGKPKGQRQMVQ